jgi:glutaredoxin
VIVNTNRVREINRELILNSLREKRSLTKNELSKNTGLSISTCRNILNDLLNSGEVEEQNYVSSNGGRPSRQFSLNIDFTHIGTLYLRIEGEVSIIFISIFNLIEEVIFEKKVEYDEIDLDTIKMNISSLLDHYPKLKSISIGVPGVVIDGAIGICDLKKIEHIDIKKVLEDEFPLNIIAENDVNASALGFYHNSSSSNEESFIYLYYPYLGNPGAGIVVNGRIIRGFSNFAGEVGFLPLGVEYKDLGSLQNNSPQFLNLVSNTITTLNSVINPKQICLSWVKLDEENFEQINNRVKEISIKGHIPTLIYNSNLHDDYIKGLRYLAFKEISCDIEVLKR